MSRGAGVFRKIGENYGVLILVLVFTVIGSNILQPGILSLQNVSSMITFGVEIGLIALGETLVILGGGGGIDLSVGSMYAVSQVVVGLLAQRNVNILLAVAAGLATGVAMGFINGLLVTRVKIPAIITTLATMYAFSGVALLLTDGIDVSAFPASYSFIGQGLIGGLPAQFVLLYIPAALLLWIVLSKTVYGQQLYLTGTNQLAAVLSGINVKQVRMWTYVITGFLTAVAGVVDSSRLVTARPDAGATANLAAITIAVLGGTSIFGGKGSVWGTAIATLVITLVSYSFSLANINSVIETGTIGGVLIVVILFQGYLARWFARGGRVSAKA
ncbi:MAG: ABC transporter permease [Bacilli bacterium]